ncbi:MAG: hypothetical protein R2734_03695 [Nocardioides sp.]
MTPGPAITLDKSHGTPSGSTAGSTVPYTFVVTNSGNVTLTSVSVTDPTVGAVSCPVTTLAPGASTTCTATYTLTQADIDSGLVNNTATTSGTPPTGPAVTAIDSDTLVIPRTATLTLDKQAGTPSGTTAGSTIDYTFVVTNTGNTTLTNLSVSDPTVGAVSCPVSSLAPGATTTCTATYTLTQTDVDSGHVANTATATGTPPPGVTPPTATDSTDTPIPADPAITIDKQAGTPTGNTPGATIDYTFVVTNTGNVTLDPVTVDDPTVGPVSCPATSLAPGADMTCTVTYAITQADIDAGHVANTASVTGTDPNGTDVTAQDSTDTPIAPSPSLTLDKQAGTPTGNAAGDTIDYTFVVTNTGNVTLDPVTVDDPKVGPVTCPAGPLAPGDSVTCGPVTYTLTQVDVDAGHVANTATATGTDPNGTDVTATDSTDTPIPAGPAISLDKQAGTPTLTQADVDAGHVANTATATGTDPNWHGCDRSDSTDTPPLTATPEPDAGQAGGHADGERGR